MSRCKFFGLMSLLIGLSACSTDPKVQAQRYLENGNKFFANERFKEASIMYRRALQKDLRFGEAYYRLGLTDLKLASYTEASHMLIRAVELQPTNSDAATKLADLYLVAAVQDQARREDLTKEAASLSDKLIALNAKSFDGHRIAGQVALLRNDPVTAVKEFAVANDVRPNQPDLVLAYFQALIGTKKTEEAEKLALGLLEKEKNYGPMYDLMYYQYTRTNDLDKAEQILIRKTANNPKNADFVLQLAAHYFLSQRTADMEAQIQKLGDTKTFPQGHLFAGDFYLFRLRAFDQARREYEAGMQAIPSEKAVYQKRLVELYANTGRNSEANDLITTVLKENPKDSDAIAMRAALMLTTGSREQINVATNDLQSLVAKNPTNHFLRFNLARGQLAKGDLEQARIQLEEALKIRTDFIAARELLTRVLIAKGDAARALKEAETLLAVDRSNLTGHLIRSSALLALNEKDKARDELALIQKAYPNNPEARYQIGYLAYQDKDYKQAEKLFTQLYKDNPKDIRGLVGIVETMASQSKMPDAVAEMRKAAAAEPERRDLRLALANLLVRSEKYDEALSTFNGLIEKEPKNADLLYRMAETYRRKGDLNSAMEKFRASSLAAPNSPVPLLALSLMMEGMGKRDQVKPIYEQILKIQPDQPVALNNLAFLKAEEGTDLDQALTMAQRARQKEPGSTDIADTLGWIYIKKNLSEDAIRLFSELIQKEPKNATYRYHFGMALMQKGDRNAARRELSVALQSNPSDDEKTKIQKLLDTM